MTKTMQLRPIKHLIRLSLSLTLISLLAGCSGKSNCPVFPVPNESVIEKFDKLAETDRDIWEWGNKLSDLQEELEDCGSDYWGKK